MEKINLILSFMLSIPKTIYFNLRVLPFKKAIKLPIIISNSVQIKKIYKNCIDIKNDEIKPFMIKIGFSGSKAIRNQRGMIYLNKKKGGKLVFEGKAKFSSGITLYNNSGTTCFGENFIANKNLFISCDSKITFGKDCLLGWNIDIRDSDGHKILPGNKVSREIKIGNHVWICAKVDILKGNNIGDDCIVAYNSCLTGIVCGNNKLIGGYPAKIIKEDVNWEK